MVVALRVPQDFALLRLWKLAPWWVAGLCSDRREAPTGQSCGAPQVSHGAAAPAGRHSDSGAPHTHPTTPHLEASLRLSSDDLLAEQRENILSSLTLTILVLTLSLCK